MSLSDDHQRNLTPEQVERQFELTKLDYSRLSAQEQGLMDKRLNIWIIFFAIVSAPSGYAGVVGLKGSIYVFCLVPFFLMCIALDVKHDEKVLRYDVRKSMRKLAETWDFSNHDSAFTNQDGSRWWHGYYKLGKGAAFVGTEIMVSGIVCWYFFDTARLPILSGTIGIVNLVFILITYWCMF